MRVLMTLTPTIGCLFLAELARLLLTSAEFGWPRPYDDVDTVLQSLDDAAEGLHLLRRSALSGHRNA